MLHTTRIYDVIKLWATYPVKGKKLLLDKNVASQSRVTGEYQNWWFMHDTYVHASLVLLCLPLLCTCIFPVGLVRVPQLQVQL